MPILNEVCCIEFPLHKGHVKLEHNWCTATSKLSPLQNKVVQWNMTLPWDCPANSLFL